MTKPSEPTEKPRSARGPQGLPGPRSGRSKKAELAAWLERIGPATIGEAEWDELRALLAPVSENYLRRLLRDSGVPMTPLVEGVRQENLDALEASLLGMLIEYQRGDRERKTLVRRLVIAAKDHARWAARDRAKRAGKEEMALWLATWLENPPLFPEWVRLRRAAASRPSVD